MQWRMIVVWAMTPIEHIRRNVLQINQRALAEIMGCNQAQISRWENGIGGPRLGAMIRLRQAVGAAWSDDWLWNLPLSPAATKPRQRAAKGRRKARA
jgi:transcriptional regulator with XRE-family HTH domain